MGLGETAALPSEKSNREREGERERELVREVDGKEHGEL